MRHHSKPTLLLVFLSGLLLSTSLAGGQKQQSVFPALQRAVKLAHAADNNRLAPAFIVADLQDPAHISGQLTGIVDDDPAGAEVFAWQVSNSDHGNFIMPGIVNDDHSYEIDNLPPGEYVVIAYVPGYVPEFYGNTIDRDSARVIMLASGEWVADIDIVLEKFPQTPSFIASRIVEDQNGAAIDSAVVTAFAQNNPFLFLQAFSDINGKFVLKNILPGKYTLQAESGNYLTEFYQNAADFQSATALIISDSTQITDIIISLEPAGSISGSVTYTDGHPLAGAMLFAISTENTDMSASGTAAVSAPDGRYVLGNLKPGSYFVKAVFMEGMGYREQWWRGDSSAGPRTPLKVERGATIAGIDFVFSMQKMDGRIEGFVYDSQGAPLEAAQVYLESDYRRNDDPNGGFDLLRPVFGFFAETDADGFFQFLNLPAGDFVASATYSQAGQYTTIWWNSARTREEADIITIDDSSSAPVEVSFSLPVKSHNSAISGYIFDENDRPLQNAWINVQAVEIHRCDGRIDPDGHCNDQTRGWAQTDSSGFYRVDRLAPDDYFVHAQYWEGFSFAEMWFENAATRAAATPVTIAQNSEYVNTNFYLKLRPFYGSVTGLVREKSIGLPITRALVELTPVWHDKIMAPIWFWNYTTTVDDSGRFEFNWLPQGDYLVSIYADGAFAYYENVPVPQLADSVHVSAGEIREIAFDLQPRNDGAGSISGRLVSEDAGMPIDVGVVIARPAITILLWPDSELFYTAVTQTNGRYELAGLPDGEFLLLAFADNFIPEYYDNSFDPAAVKMITIKDGVAVGGIDFELTPMVFLRNDEAGNPTFGGMAQISGVVSNESGSPLTNAQVYLYNESGSVVAAARTNSAGQYVFSGIPSGNYRVSASYFGSRSQYNGISENLENAPVVVVAGDVGGIDFRLASGMTTSVEAPANEPLQQGLQLLGNFPNPFNPQTRIKFTLAESRHVKLMVYTLLGREVATVLDEKLERGEYAITWDARDTQGKQLGSGLYFYQISAENWLKTGKMILQK